MPTGFKNSTDGSISIAIDACRAARSGHVFLSVGKEGLSSIVETEGNEDIHIILRGGTGGPNYDREHVEKCVEGLKKGGVNWRLMVSSIFITFLYGKKGLSVPSIPLPLGILSYRCSGY